MTLDELTFGGPYRVAQLRYKTDDGFHRETRAPGSDLSDLPKDIQARIATEWTRGVVEAYREATKEVPVEPEPPSAEATKIADLESRLAKLEAAELDRKALSLRD